MKFAAFMIAIILIILSVDGLEERIAIRPISDNNSTEDVISFTIPIKNESKTIEEIKLKFNKKYIKDYLIGYDEINNSINIAFRPNDLDNQTRRSAQREVVGLFVVIQQTLKGINNCEYIEIANNSVIGTMHTYSAWVEEIPSNADRSSLKYIEELVNRTLDTFMPSASTISYANLINNSILNGAEELMSDEQSHQHAIVNPILIPEKCCVPDQMSYQICLKSQTDPLQQIIGEFENVDCEKKYLCK